MEEGSVFRAQVTHLLASTYSYTYFLAFSLSAALSSLFPVQNSSDSAIGIMKAGCISAMQCVAEFA